MQSKPEIGRTWDTEAYAAKARERIDAEAQLEASRLAATSTAVAPVAAKNPLQRRDAPINLVSRLGEREMVTGAQAATGDLRGNFHCKVCNCFLRDSASYLAHVNGRKHNRALGMSMRVERSTLSEVTARLSQPRAGAAASSEQADPRERGAELLREFDERLRRREAEEREETRGVKRARSSPNAAQGDAAKGESGSSTAVKVAAQSDAATASDTAEAAAMAAMGFDFGSFGGSKKNS